MAAKFSDVHTLYWKSKEDCNTNADRFVCLYCKMLHLWQSVVGVLKGLIYYNILNFAGIFHFLNYIYNPLSLVLCQHYRNYVFEIIIY